MQEGSWNGTDECTNLLTGATAETKSTWDNSTSTRRESAKKNILVACFLLAIAVSCFLVSSSPTTIYPLEKILSSSQRHASPCGTLSNAVFADMHDGDQKIVSIVSSNQNVLQIHSASEDESWTVTAPLDPNTCTAMVDFDVPGKPSPPPVPLLVTLWTMERRSTGIHQKQKLTLEFTDPSQTIAPSKDTPLNHWVQVG
ncbi:expressed unknown protein [Seminavis robusta]|uniref:Uncharacterized protein n=1 Tax=Seminavis robusta TaxID=568900 RepID=A0A9N8DXY2_9STRA|nr:expressed unknown protein [Seminavis robusta]|eukprot:Sro328_g118730.1 n/a (199) ;mRNA; r:65039-65635